MTQRDAKWFEDAYRTHEHDVRRYVLRRVAPDAVDDIVAEVFTTLWRRHRDAPAHLLPWLLRVASNHIAHWTRTRARRANLDERVRASTTVENAQDPGQMVLAADPQIQAVLARLPEPQAEILRLARWEGLEPRDIAEVLGCSANTARVRLHRARQLAGQYLLEEQDAQ